MGSLRFSEYSDAPTVFLSPSPIHSFHPPACLLPIHHDQARPSLLSSKPSNFSQWTPATSTTPVTTNPSRKRNRDESADESSETLRTTGAKEPNRFFAPDINGNASARLLHTRGMPAVDAQIGHPLAGQKQTGNWLEVKSGVRTPAEIRATVGLGLSSTAIVTEPLEPCRKAQRRDLTSQEFVAGDRNGSNGSPKPVLEDPAIDQFTHLLGVGWSRVSEDKDVQAAARGWAKYIDNHYPLSNTKILLKSKSHDAILAETGEGYYLFKEDLSEGQLVGVDWITCLGNLQRSPITFDGSTTLKTVRTSVIIPSKTEIGAWENEPGMVTDPLSLHSYLGDDEMLVD